MPPDFLAVIRRLVGNPPDIAIPDVRTIPVPRGGRLVPGFASAWKDALENIQGQFAKMAVDFRDVVWLDGMERGSHWAFLFGLVTGVMIGIGITAKFVQVMSHVRSLPPKPPAP